MALTRALFSLILFGPVAAFVTPSSPRNVPAPHGRTQVVSEVAAVYDEAVVIGSSADKFGDAARNLAIGVMLGFVVGFSALGTKANASDINARIALGAPDAPLKLKGECIRSQGCTGEALEAWAKRTAVAQDPGDPKPNTHSIPTTGSGRYRLYGLDATSPIKNISQSTNGQYVSSTEEKLALERVEQAATRERVAPVVGRSPYTSTYSPYNAYPPNNTGLVGLDRLKINTDVAAK